MRVQRFASLADIDAAHPTIEEREEYEAPVELGHDGLRRRRLRGDPRAGRGGGGRHRLGRRQQRLPVLPSRPPDRRGRPAPGRARAALPPRRDQPAHGRRRGREQGGQRRRRRASSASSRTSPSPTRRRPIVRAASPVTLDEGPPIAGSASSSSRTARRSPTAACRSVRRRSPPSGKVPGCASTRGRPPSARSPRSTTPTRTSGRCCPRWATATSSWHELEATINATDVRRGRHRHADRPRPPDRLAAIRSGTSATSSRRSDGRRSKTSSSPSPS